MTALPYAPATARIPALEQVAPLGALLPAAWITADRLIVYLHVYGPAAVVMAAAIELLGLQIVATRTALIGREMPEQTRSMNRAFAGYLIIIVAVNGVLAVSAWGGWVEWGRIIAEMILGLIALPVSALAGVNKQLRMIDEKAQAVKDEQTAKRTQEIAERDRAEDRANALTLQLRQMEIDAAAVLRAEKRSERAEKAKKTPAKVSETFPKDRRKLTLEQKDYLSKLTAKEISEKVGVSLKSGQNWLKEWSAQHEQAAYSR